MYKECQCEHNNNAGGVTVTTPQKPSERIHELLDEINGNPNRSYRLTLIGALIKYLDEIHEQTYGK